MEFDDEEGVPHDSRIGEHTVLMTGDANSSKPYRYFRELRAFVIELLQYRAYPLWKRLVVLGSFCDQLEQLAEAGQNTQVPAAIEWFRSAIHGNLLDEAIEQQSPKPVVQLAILLELIVARITVEYVSPRFLESYREFKDGIQWSPESSMEEIAGRYTAAFSGPFAPFLNGHGHMLEHYLVNYVHRTLFPVCPQQNRREGHRAAETMREHCLMMLTYYGIIQAVTIGVAAFYGAEFGPSQAIRVMQSVTKAFEHNLSYPERALKILAEKGVRSCVSMAILVRN
jgi:lysine-N-methylase